MTRKGIERFHFVAYCPDPRGGGNNFTYDDTVDVPAKLAQEVARRMIIVGFADHIKAQTGVQVDPQYVVVQSLEVVDPVFNG